MGAGLPGAEREDWGRMSKNHNLHNRNGVWQLRAWVDGREVAKSLKTRDVKEARRLRDAMLADLQGASGTPAPAEVALSEALGVFRGSLCTSCASNGSQSALSASYGRFLRWLPVHICKIGEVTAAMAYSYAKSLHADGLAPGTCNQHIGQLSHLFGVIRKDFRARGLPEPCENPFADIPRRKPAVVGRKPFEAGDVRRLLMIAPNEDWSGVILLAAHSGLRRVDCFCLRWSDVDLSRRILSVLPAKTRGKSDRRAVIGVSDELLAMLTGKAGGCADDLVFPDLARMYQNKRWQCDRTFSRMVRQIGIDSRVDAGSVRARAVFSFHSLRHSCKTWLLQGGVSDSIVDLWLGHSSGRASQAYVHGDKLDKLLIKAAECLPSLAGSEAGRVIEFRAAS